MTQVAECQRLGRVLRSDVPVPGWLLREQTLRQCWEYRRAVGEKHLWGEESEEAGLGKAVKPCYGPDKTGSAGTQAAC